jgi:hypothetical protein
MTPELTPAELEILLGPIWGVHVSSVYHRPEFHNLMKKGLLTYENQSRWPYKPSFFLVLIPAGKELLKEINMTETYYKQCSLKRIDGHVDTAWIPEQFAKKGHYIKIKRGDKWENGWQVQEVFGRESETYLLAYERDYLIQREASDV